MNSEQIEIQNRRAKEMADQWDEEDIEAAERVASRERDEETDDLLRDMGYD